MGDQGRAVTDHFRRIAMSFKGYVLKPAKKENVSVPEGDVWHLSQACLHEPKAGKNYIQVEVRGETYTLTHLEKDKVEHNALDLFFGSEGATFGVKGNSEVHLLGYLEPAEEKEDEEEESEEEEEKGNASPKAAPKASPKKEPEAGA